MKNIYNSSNTLGLKTEELCKCLLGIQVFYLVISSQEGKNKKCFCV